MCHSGRMKRVAHASLATLLFVVSVAPSAAQTSLDSFQVYTEHPRLFLRPQRLRLLRREHERGSMRWDQFRLLVNGGAPMPEPGFAYALFSRVSGDPAASRRAIDWALTPGRDLRQIALVYDWCQEALSSAEKQKLLERLRAGLHKPANTWEEWRSAVLAAVAVAGDDDPLSQSVLSAFVQGEWLGRTIPALRSGHPAFRGEDTYALFEIFHAIRDNLNADLREDFPAYFRELPLFDLLSYYPPPFPAAENEFRIPFSTKTGEPDLQVAALSRAGELAMVAFDTNGPASQVLQGWLMNDRFLMRGAFGIPYEFLWANPYQPGLSYYHVPLVLHDDLLGRLLVRSSWDDDARWAGYIDGNLQEFRDGRVVPMDARAAREPIDLDEAAIFFSSEAHKLQSGKKDANDVFVVGLAPRAPYHVEVDDEDMREMTSDPGGILYLKGMRPQTFVRFNPESVERGPTDLKSR